jgi:hypothetical protein
MIRSSKTIIVFIVSTGLLGTAVLLTMMKAALRASNPATVQRDVWVGDILPALPNYSWGEHDHSLVLAVRVECSHCRASAPFYRQLQSIVPATTNRVGIIAVFPNPPDKVRAFLQQFNLDIPAVSSTPLEQLAVSGTPTLILTDSKGAVMRVWVGELDTEERRELLAQLRSYLGAKER